MATVEELQTSLDALRAEFEEFKAYAMPVIAGHQPGIAPTASKFDNPPTPEPKQ
jgi:hypothetical protein